MTKGVKPLDPKAVVTIQELALSPMLEIGALCELIFETGLIPKEEFIPRFRKLDSEMKDKRKRKPLV